MERLPQASDGGLREGKGAESDALVAHSPAPLRKQAQVKGLPSAADARWAAFPATCSVVLLGLTAGAGRPTGG